MGNKPRKKLGVNALNRKANESDYKLQVLFNEIQRMNNWIEYVHKLTTEYIAWKGDEGNFKEHLKEIINADKEKSGELHKSPGTDNKTRKGKSGTKKGKKGFTDTHRNTTKRSKIKDTGESGSIGV